MDYVGGHRARGLRRSLGLAALVVGLSVALMRTSAPAQPEPRSTPEVSEVVTSATQQHSAQVAEPASEDAGHGFAQFPEAFIRSASGKWEIAVSGEDGTLVVTSAGNRVLTDRWVRDILVLSPDERLLAYLRETDSDRTQLMVASLRDGTRRVVSERSSIDPPIVFSSDGTLLAFVAAQADGVRGVYAAALTRQPIAAVQATNRGVTSDAVRTGDPAFTPLPESTLTITARGISWTVDGKQYSAQLPPF